MSEALTALQKKIEQLLSEQARSPVVVRDLQPLAGGACQDNYRVDLTFSGGELEGERTLALRSDARKPLPGSLGRKEEFAVVSAAVAAKVRTPAVRWLTQGLVRDGAWAYFMDWVEGEAIGRRVVRNPELTEARAKLPGELAEQLARIHSITPAQLPELAELRGGTTGEGAASAALAFVRDMVDRMPEPHPALELCVKWLIDHAPQGTETVLTHGDFRTGNFMVTPAGLSAVLDWEFAHFSDPMEDLGWLCVRDWRFGQLALPVGGFARREPMYEAYQRASGRTVDPKRVHYWEVMGNVRWAAGSVYQGERYLSGEETDIELVAIARRAVEMEFEAIRLIEKGV